MQQRKWLRIVDPMNRTIQYIDDTRNINIDILNAFLHLEFEKT